MRENYEDYVPERDPITKETAQESEDLDDDLLASFDDGWSSTDDQYHHND